MVMLRIPIFKSTFFALSLIYGILPGMSKETIVFCLGIILTLLPFLGIPEQWKQYTVASIGAILVLIGYMLRRTLYFKQIDRGNGERGDDSFVETTKQLFDERELQ
jgi:heme/copper-type cytochrome/quinol oxidase subunit 4